MADVTDAAFRRIIAKYGKPDIMFTEFTSADGLCNTIGRKKLLINLQYNEEERPIVAQLFGANPEHMEKSAELVKKLSFDGLDINMGCPDRSVEDQGAGAALMKNPKLARKIIQAAKNGAPALPVSVKTRIGYSKFDENFFIEILKENLAALTVHLRTRKEMSEVPAHWELMPKIVELRNKISPETLIIGNGDIKDLKEGREKAKQYGCDGIMIGRAALGNPFLFSENKNVPNEVEGRLKVLLEHAMLFKKLFTGRKNFAVMKKHFKAYVAGFAGAKELRIKLMEAENAAEVKKIINIFLRRYGSGR
ncbi:hypothetical protein A3A09_00295 [Candidatus Nomurabacteria bacterium RIFCSPLOWO2_01_FULL_42_20]|uniref:tRNA-dihydrouridine synthase n=1 Tax=Candidatus Nomurabacteria bacterium RIFCSPHIGHO2_01_FULL_42_16 TaxID=1801743 RepID=A0A1F6VJB9_9BACT|nr:MAG: hypothetical protein A2824_03735 [Candidatus Nomurabacteria bacterium RIFCSPHIGHO2_01_FULL_42_16]OGI91653.1 MAG: hypothetical protein A3A09_00295 [Candidatus Nomurabacteria bacterium RIFCSPLOWO2_01_FULL_42_20]